jgi:hypothetical protein
MPTSEPSRRVPAMPSEPRPGIWYPVELAGHLRPANVFQPAGSHLLPTAVQPVGQLTDLVQLNETRDDPSQPLPRKNTILGTKNLCS